MSNFVYIITMIVVTFAIRFAPFLIFKKPVKNRILKSFFYYLPYVTLALMTFPAIINESASPLVGFLCLAVSILFSLLKFNCFAIALSVSAVCLLFELL